LKRGGQRETFDRSKLLRGVVRSCEKTGIDLPTLEQLVDRIEMDLQQGGKRDVTSSELGQQVLHHLRPLSEVAYIRFASVYGKFQGIRDFMETLNHLQAHPIGGEDIPLCDRQENDARCSPPEAKMTTDTDQWVCPPSTVEAIGLRPS